MNYTKILGLLLDLGAAMIKSGAETHRVEDSLYRLCAAYRFTQANVWVVPSNIQATVTDPDGAVQTQVRHVRQPGVNFDVLDRLNDVSRRCCADTPDETELARRLSEATANRAGRWLRYSAAVLAGVGFGVFFYCDAVDALVAALASLLITALGRLLSKRESNPLVLNFIISFVTELFILLCVKLGFGHHTGYITVGVVMLLISALGTTNGVRDLVHLDTLSGVMNITASLTGAIGIALGIALPILLLPCLTYSVMSMQWSSLSRERVSMTCSVWHATSMIWVCSVVTLVTSGSARSLRTRLAISPRRTATCRLSDKLNIA